MTMAKGCAARLRQLAFAVEEGEIDVLSFGESQELMRISHSEAGCEGCQGKHHEPTNERELKFRYFGKVAS